MEAEHFQLKVNDEDWIQGQLKLTIVKVEDLPRMDTFSAGDPYVTVHLGGTKWARTNIQKKTKNPVFDHVFHQSVCHKGENFLFKVKDMDADASKLVGTCQLSIEEVKACEEEKLFELPLKLEGSFSESKHNPHLFLTARFVLADTDAEPEVTHTYWQGHDDGYVRLFHDAHVPEEHRQEVLLSNGDRYQDTSLWELMYKRISNAKSFIYIAGWSVFVPTRLIRRENEEEIPTLGELLKKKADEGVEVVVMVWDEVMSVKYLMEAGLMGTHDEETHRYFDGTKVNCVKFSRTGDMKKKSILKRIVFSSKQLFSVTHHQKTVVCDAPTRNQAKICAFVGGIDLCDGRYDTADHCLYRRMLSYEYPASDYHNPGDNSFHAKNAPRQPWHDTHSYIEGTAAWHVLQNFRERYNSQSSSKAPRLSNWTDTVGSETLADREKDENWNVQIFRSIDSHVAAFEDNTSELFEIDSFKVDNSIHEAYVHQIRRAKKFIYIENQYFIGSSHLWENPSDICRHVIPAEIARKICKKIEAGEEFCAYVVMPMWPEGPAPDIVIQEIMAHQNETRKMMYSMIARALQKAGSKEHPLRYLVFLCVGNREEEGSDEGKLDISDASKYGETLSKTRRYMIYVHSKMMVVDDEYVILGSANINMRSMAGERDTEICSGMFQKKYRATLDACPQGQVYGYRRACMGEHLGGQSDMLEKPWTSESNLWIREQAAKNWELYSQDNPVNMPSHLLPMPFMVDMVGTVTAHPDYPHILDTTAKVLGEKSSVIPTYVTT